MHESEENPVHDDLENRDDLENNDRVYLEKLRLAAAIILELGEESVIPATLESELWVFKDRIERTLLLAESGA